MLSPFPKKVFKKVNSRREQSGFKKEKEEEEEEEKEKEEKKNLEERDKQYG